MHRSKKCDNIVIRQCLNYFMPRETRESVSPEPQPTIDALKQEVDELYEKYIKAKIECEKALTEDRSGNELQGLDYKKKRLYRKYNCARIKLDHFQSNTQSETDSITSVPHYPQQDFRFKLDKTLDTLPRSEFARIKETKRNELVIFLEKVILDYRSIEITDVERYILEHIICDYALYNCGVYEYCNVTAIENLESHSDNYNKHYTNQFLKYSALQLFDTLCQAWGGDIGRINENNFDTTIRKMYLINNLREADEIES